MQSFDIKAHGAKRNFDSDWLESMDSFSRKALTVIQAVIQITGLW